MAPAGTYGMASAAIRAGAHSIYFGVGKLNMRSKSVALGADDVYKLARLCRSCNVKSYLALNTLIYDDDMPEMRRLCDLALDAGVSAVIASDIATILYARQIGLEVHMSVQANVTNIAAVEFYSRYADVVVLARELTLEQIAYICEQIKLRDLRGPAGQLMRVEVFIHGALCIAVSGKCGMSLATTGSSANRGACTQPCRRRYKVSNADTGSEFIIDNEYVMSPRDICLIEYMDKLVEAGVSVLKIEGRGKTPDYVSCVVQNYARAIAALQQGCYDDQLKQELLRNLETVYNRKFWLGGYYLGKRLDEWAESDHSQASLKRVQVGSVSNVFQKLNVMEFRLNVGELRPGDLLLVEGHTTGALRHEIDKLYVDGKPAELAEKGAMVTVAMPAKVRRGDKVYMLQKLK